MSKDLTVKKDINEQHELSVIERVVMQGDLAKLSPEQRVTYYHSVCKSIGLNPFTRPFDYISLNGKLTLYAKKDATEQLRQLKHISIVSLEGRIIDDLYIVTAKATTPDGRIDQATGAVTLGHLKGDAKANAIMKAETKAKRRVTLSIGGMGWTDESELESMPDATRADVDLLTGEIKDNPQQQKSQLFLQNSHVSMPPKEVPAVVDDKPKDPPSKLEGFDAFKEKYSSEYGKVIDKFVAVSSANSKMHEIAVWNYAMKNEDTFQERFDKWRNNNPQENQVIEAQVEMM